MPSKRPRVAESPDEANTIPSLESPLRQQHQELLDAFTRLEAHHKQVVAESEKQINDLKRQIQELRSENESPRRTTTSFPPAVVSQVPNPLANRFNQIARAVSRLNLTTYQGMFPYSIEVEAMCRVLCSPSRSSDLQRFLQQFSDEDNHGIRYCVDVISTGCVSEAPLIAQGKTCTVHKDRDVCVWVTKRELGWVIGSGRLS